MNIANVMKILRRACTKHIDHADNIISAETERGFALAQAAKCRRRGDDKGYGKELKQAHKFILASLRETAEAGIIGNHIYADKKASSVELIARMG
jgi:hypothetical protein